MDNETKLSINSVFFVLSILLTMSCTTNKTVYQSKCDDGVSFKKIGFTQLIDSIKNYDHQYVEVSGTYREGKEQSALVNDSLFTDHSDTKALWINFSQDCPLYLKGTHTGLFEATDGAFTNINNKRVTIRGKIDLQNKGHKGLYKAALDHVSFIEL